MARLKLKATRPPSADSPEDTIMVKQKSPAVVVPDESDNDSPLSDLERIEQEMDGPPSRSVVISAQQTNRPWGRKGKAPLRDSANEADNHIEMEDDGGDIEEYDFGDEPDDEDEDDHEHDTAYYKPNHSMPIASSDDENDDNWQEPISYRPWKLFNEKERIDWELMYCAIPPNVEGRDMRMQEDYIRERDRQMLAYLEDFPLAKWLIPQAEAKRAYEEHMERSRWRDLGIRIYPQQRPPEFVPGTTNPHHAMYMQHARMMQTPRAMDRRDYPQLPNHSQNLLNGMNGMNLHSHHSLSQRLGPQSMQSGLNVRGNFPPPHNVLRSQPSAQPVPTYPNGVPIHQTMGAPNLPPGVPQQMPGPGAKPLMPPSIPQMPPATSASRRKKKETPPTEPPPPPPPTPPYEKRDKPAERKPASKAGRKPGMRRQAEAELFPWNRQLDFKVAKAEAAWDDSIYDKATLESMAVTRAKNEPIIERIDQEESERQRKSRQRKRRLEILANEEGLTRISKKKGEGAEGDDNEPPRKRPGRQKASDKAKAGEPSSDPYHSGHFAFVTKEDEDKAVKLGRKDAYDLIEDAETGKVDPDLCGDIKICWNPGKKGITEELEQAKFSVKDSALTRRQLVTCPILTNRAAQCVVDFCPDLLWRELLLRIASEAGYGNKDMRDRMCHNGNYCDKATITKRIGAALGQKQQQNTTKKQQAEAEKEDAKNKGYAKGEDVYYNENAQDFSDYITFFGKRTSHRTMLKIPTAGSKRKREIVTIPDDDADVDVDAIHATGSSLKALTMAKVDVPSPDTTSDPVTPATTSPEATSGPSSEDVSAAESDGDNADAVSVQSDTILDQMDED